MTLGTHTEYSATTRFPFSPAPPRHPLPPRKFHRDDENKNIYSEAPFYIRICIYDHMATLRGPNSMSNMKVYKLWSRSQGLFSTFAPRITIVIKLDPRGDSLGRRRVIYNNWLGIPTWSQVDIKFPSQLLKGFQELTFLSCEFSNPF